MKNQSIKKFATYFIIAGFCINTIAFASEKPAGTSYSSDASLRGKYPTGHISVSNSYKYITKIVEKNGCALKFVFQCTMNEKDNNAIDKIVGYEIWNNSTNGRFFKGNVFVELLDNSQIKLITNGAVFEYDNDNTYRRTKLLLKGSSLNFKKGVNLVVSSDKCEPIDSNGAEDTSFQSKVASYYNQANNKTSSNSQINNTNFTKKLKSHVIGQYDYEGFLYTAMH